MTNQSNSTTTIRISASSFAYLFLFLGAIWLAWQVADILVLLFLCMIVAAALDPSVKAISRLGVPRWLAIVSIYLAFISLIGLAVYLLVPAVTAQINTISQNIPTYQARIQQTITGQPVLEDIWRRVGRAATNIGDQYNTQALSLTFGVFGSIFGFLTFLVLTFYMLIGGKKLGMSVVELVPDKSLQKRIVDLGLRISSRLGGWLRGQALLSLSIFILSLIILTVLGVDYALTLALIAGIMELVPLLGAYLGALPAVLVAFTTGSPTQAALVALGYLLMQQFQGNIITPQVMKRALGVPPIVIFTAVLVGGKLLGFIGVLLAAPVAAVIAVVAEDVIANHPRLRATPVDSSRNT
ncbi:AI-2E family transporter [bacterium]|nr:AI-2E family transporter [bacterium]